MQASRIPIALPAFAAGVLIAAGVSWVLNVGKSDAASAQEDHDKRPALTIDNADNTLADLEGSFRPASNSAAARVQVENRSSLEFASNTRTNTGGQPFDLEASIAKLSTATSFPASATR